MASARALVSSMPLHRRAGAQPDRDRDRLVLLEQQRRQLGADAEPVAAARAADGVDRVAEPAQPVDVVADGPVGDAEPLGELGAGPVGAGLEQPEQGQHPGRGVRHRSSSESRRNCRKETFLNRS